MDFGKLYTVEEVAALTGLTDRTIRNYLKDGKLKGRKVGAQWRFTEANVNALFMDMGGSEDEIAAAQIAAETTNNETVSETVQFVGIPEDENNQILIKFYNEQQNAGSGACAVVDYPLKEEGTKKALLWKMMSAANAYSEEVRPSYTYTVDEEKKRIRFFLVGDVEKVGEMMTFVTV